MVQKARVFGGHREFVGGPGRSRDRLGPGGWLACLPPLPSLSAGLDLPSRVAEGVASGCFACLQCFLALDRAE